LERSQGLPADQITAVRKAIQSAESSPSELAKLKGLASSIETNAGTAKSAADSNRLHALAEILKDPAR